MSVRLQVVDVEGLRQQLPLSRQDSSTEARERLFKELVVRANCLVQMGQTKASKARSRAWIGTLSLENLRPLLRQALGSKVDCDSSSFNELADQACHVARTWFEPVSATDHECVDLNQWHVLLFALATGLGLASAAPWQPSKNGWTLELPDFANLCQRLATGTTRLSDYPIPEAVQEKLRSWASAPSEAPLDMEGAPNFQLFLQRLVTSQLPYWHTAEEELQTRKRAFQLLKLMNNTPSLPNSVPGKLTPRSSCASVAPLLTLPPSQWQSATRRSFPEKRREVPVAPKFVWPLTTN
ncbi:unnamed protein product [Effrenium voratum]|uniref:Uncharacterized protein n=1 Tax=Effrenium voratum TaxID=2562239 RepID=A0AA36J7C1_9DINO|nr:unnamed protein product [Effrenium voratum]CAJ1416677.1 unnamed protein product [Effrenium voratum]